MYIAAGSIVASATGSPSVSVYSRKYLLHDYRLYGTHRSRTYRIMSNKGVLSTIVVNS